MDKKYFSTILILIFLLFFFITQISQGYKVSKEYYKRNDIIKDAMDWLKQNSNKSDGILVGDTIVYQYFIDNPLASYSQANMWASQFLQKNKINDPLVGYAAFLASYNIKYFVAYDSTMSWFYTYTKDMALSFAGKQYNFNDILVKLIPLKKFEKNQEQVILYKMEIEQINKTLENLNSTSSQ